MLEYDIDNLTLVLLLAIVGVLIYERVAKPSSLVHPLLLGRQAEVSTVRQPGESGVYRSFATGHGTPLMVRPANILRTTNDIGLADQASLLQLGLRALFPFKSPKHASVRPIVVLPGAPNALLLLAIAAEPSSPLIILETPALLSQALEGEPGIIVAPEHLAEGVIEQAAEANGCGVLVVGDSARRLETFGRKAAGYGVDVRFWQDVFEAGADMKGLEIARPQPSDIHSTFLPARTTFTHQNFTAGIAGLLALFPADKRPSERDTVASTIPLTQPIGLTIALAAVWSGAAFVQGTQGSILFGTSNDHANLTRPMQDAYRSSALAGRVINSKLRDLQEGYTGRTGVWDKLVWKGIHRNRYRAVVIVGDTPSPAQISLSTALLSLPISRISTSPHSAGPITVSHFYDLQAPLPIMDVPYDAQAGGKAHSGAPANNVEVVLRRQGSGTGEDEVREGRLWARGPALAGGDRWVDTGLDASVAANGTFTLT